MHQSEEKIITKKILFFC